MALRVPCAGSEPFAGSFPDAFKVFEGYAPVGLFRFAYDPLRQAVVYVALVAAFPFRELLEVPFCGLGACRLEFGADALVPRARLLRSLRGVCFAVGVGGDVGHAQVNSKPIFRHSWWRFFDFHGSKQVKLAASVDEIGLTAPRAEQITGARAAD